MKRRVIAVYEDARGEQIVNFGPHSLALAHVADRLGVHRWELKAIEANPKKGATKAIDAARLLADTNAIVLLLLDEDRIRDQLGLGGDATDEEVRAVLSTRCPRVEVVLLRRNTEDLVAAAAQALAAPVPEAKDRVERDRILNSLADTQNPMLRANVLVALPTWKQWVDVLDAAARRAGFP